LPGHQLTFNGFSKSPLSDEFYILVPFIFSVVRFSFSL